MVGFDRLREEGKLSKIFGRPKPPRVVTQKQFDTHDKELAELARKPWSALNSHDWWYYGLDLCYVDLQQDLFDWLFPGFVALWRRGLAERQNIPHNECDFYRPLKLVFESAKLMDKARKSRLLDYMAASFLKEVETITPGENGSTAGPNEKTGFFLEVFHALGQSVPVTARIVDGLAGSLTPGKARYWITLAAGLFFPEQQVPWSAPWTEAAGGGGIILFKSYTDIYDSGFMPENWNIYRNWLTIDLVRERLELAQKIDLEPDEFNQIQQLLTRSEEDRGYAERKLDWYLTSLNQPGLSGESDHPDYGYSAEDYV